MATLANEQNERDLSNREFKASVFTTYYGTPENAADLYQGLEHADGITPEDIRYTTLSGVMFMARKNDLAFTAKEKVLVISEHQSTENKNMPLRSAIYFGRTMEFLIPSKQIYRTGRIAIPTPEFYSFYNGKKSQPAERTLKLSDAYLEKTDSPMLELVVKEININPEVGHPILQKCRSLYEYSAFIQKIRDYMNSGEERGDAITQAMEDCVRDGVMVEFIRRHGSEVRNMLFTEFNMEDALEVRGEESFAEGLAEGLAKGKAESISLIHKKYTKQKTPTQIADELELEEDYVRRVMALFKEHPEADDVRIAAMLLVVEEQ